MFVISSVLSGGFSAAHAQTALEINGIPTETGFDFKALSKNIANCDSGNGRCSLSAHMKLTSSFNYADIPNDHPFYARLYRYGFSHTDPYENEKVHNRLKNSHDDLPEVKRLKELQRLARQNFIHHYECAVYGKPCPSYFTDQSPTIYDMRISIIPNVGDGEAIAVSVEHHVDPGPSLTLKSVHNAMKRKYPNNAPADFSKVRVYGNGREGFMAPDGKSVLFANSVFNNRSDYAEYTLNYKVTKAENTRLLMQAVKNRLAYLDAEYPKALNAVIQILDNYDNQAADVDF